MFTPVFFTALLGALAVVRADPTPQEPGPGDSFNEGATCHTSWDVDTSGTWKQMAIELMTGDNYHMVHLTTIATVDGTDPTKTTFEYPCPQVTPNSAIYFYQFSAPVPSSSPSWTTRFTIADAQGKSVPPAQTTQPGGGAIPWGVGALVDPSSATPPPTWSSLISNGTSSAVGGGTVPSSSGSASGAVFSTPGVVASASSAAASTLASTPSGMSRASSAAATGTRAASSSAPSASTTSNAGAAVEINVLRAVSIGGALALLSAMAL